MVGGGECSNDFRDRSSTVSILPRFLFKSLWSGGLCLNDGETKPAGEVPDLHSVTTNDVEAVSLHGQGGDGGGTLAGDLSLSEPRGGAVDEDFTRL